MASKIATASLPFARTFDEAAKNLMRFGFTRLEFPALPELFPQVVTRFAALTQSASDCELLKISVDRENQPDGTPDLGLRYVHRGEKKKNPRPDEIAQGRTEYDETKFVYQGNERVLGYYADSGVAMRHSSFFFATQLAHAQCITLSLEIADRMDILLPGYHFARRILDAGAMARLRLLRYLCNGTLPGIAKPHWDINFLSNHVMSDRSGLWLADRNGTIYPNAGETAEDSVLLFFGYKAWAVTRGELPGIAHGALDPTFGQKGREPRHTMVDFQHVYLTEEEEAWCKEHMHLVTLPEHLLEYGGSQPAMVAA